MASGGERRMLFDIRGRRKHVIRVVYAILALLMGASLFLVVGPVSIGSLLGNQPSASTSTASIYEERAENLERKLRKKPGDATLLLGLARARIGAGTAKVETNPTTGRPVVSEEARSEFEKGAEAWRSYLKQAHGERSASAAAMVARAYFTLAASSSEYEELFGNLKKAAAAQGVVVAARPSVNSLTTLAEFELLAGDFGAGAKAIAKAESLAPSKTTKKAISRLAGEKRKVGKELKKGAKEAAKAEKGKGKEQLKNPLGGFGGATSVTGG